MKDGYCSWDILFSVCLADLLQSMKSVLNLFFPFWPDNILSLLAQNRWAIHSSIRKNAKLVEIGFWSLSVTLALIKSLTFVEFLRLWFRNLLSTPSTARQGPLSSLGPSSRLQAKGCGARVTLVGSPWELCWWEPAWSSCRCPRRSGQCHGQSDLWGTWYEGHTTSQGWRGPVHLFGRI